MAERWKKLKTSNVFSSFILCFNRNRSPLMRELLSYNSHTSTPIRNLKLKTRVKDLNLTQIPKNESAVNENSHFTKTNLNLNRNNGSK